MEFEGMNSIRNFTLLRENGLKIGIPKDAEKHLKEALALDPEYVDALITLASLYNENRTR